jgi:dolichyl-phosphate-mannose-protein mannosyltransferase
VNEVSCYGDPNNAKFLGDFNDHWRVEILNKEATGTSYLDAVKSKFRLIHAQTGCKLYSHDVRLPKWGISHFFDF